MFLRQLSKEQKKMFLELALKAAEVNHIVEESEKILLDAYADEMGIEPIVQSLMELPQIIEGIKEISSKKDLNQMMFEILGMMMIDMSYDEEEKCFVKKLSIAWCISEKTIEKMTDYVKEYMNVVNKINILLEE